MIHYYNMNHDRITVQEAMHLLDSDERIIARDVLQDGSVTVSTVFLVLDHSYYTVELPLLYETAVIQTTDTDEVWDIVGRWHTREQAQAGHKAIVGQYMYGPLT